VVNGSGFCRKGVNSGFRLIYAHFEKEERIVFIEIYHKSVKEKEDKERIKKYFKYVNPSHTRTLPSLLHVFRLSVIQLKITF
jgi:hypothetical protein